MTPTATFVAISILKIATAGAVSMALIIGVKCFNDFDFKFNKKKIKGGDLDDRGELLRKELRSRD